MFIWSVSSVWAGLFFFFFSSRRRHTRLVSDWSSDVCSSDLPFSIGIRPAWSGRRRGRRPSSRVVNLEAVKQVGACTEAPNTRAQCARFLRPDRSAHGLCSPNSTALTKSRRTLHYFEGVASSGARHTGHHG